ncbi:MAG: class II aldolase/adducin family protein [Oscillospiraceae bacterium]|nr:class II aldolase/adducin family protein [Oscillospiraceae bacterium]
MDILEAKKIVVEAGKQLVSSGLIARTWGNVSCRVSDTQFVITPSGRAYEGLTPDDIVLVNMNDLSYEGNIKPSSEKGIHAQCYLHRPEIGFVIHTHQANASVVSALGCDINDIVGHSREIVGDHIAVSSYGLPGTGKLRKGVVATLERSDSKALILKSHGAVCMGTDYDDAFKVAHEVEAICEKYVADRYSVVTGKVAQSFKDVFDYVADVKKRAEKPAPKVTPYDSIKIDDAIILSDKQGNVVSTVGLCECCDELITGDKYISEADMHKAIYNAREDVSSIIHSDKDAIMATSKLGKTIKPMLDDFAQIVGVTVRCAEFNPGDTLKTSKKVAKALGGKSRNAVLLRENGAICCGSDKEEAEAAEMVMEKNCKSYLSGEIFGGAKPIGKIDSVLMNFIYRVKYSKQK